MAAADLTPIKVQASRMATAGTISPKAVLAAALPALGTLAAVIVQWAVSGEFNRPELITAIVGVVSALLSGLGAYLGAPGTVAIPAEVSFEGRPAEVRRVPGP